jgi:hypothetical protein
VGSAVSGRSSPCNLPVERQLQYVDDGEFLRTGCGRDPARFRTARCGGGKQLTKVETGLIFDLN